MDVTDVMAGSRDAMTVDRVFGSPYEVDGATVIPTARVSGGAGGGESTEGEGRGYGTGFGLAARPAGIYVSRDGHIDWKPAIDVNRIVLGGQVIAIVALLTARAFARSGAGEGSRTPRARRGGRGRRARGACGPWVARAWAGRRG